MSWQRNTTHRGGKKRGPTHSDASYRTTENEPACRCCQVKSEKCGKRVADYTKKHTTARCGMPVAWGWNGNGGAFNGGRHPATVLGCPRPTWMMLQ